MKFMKKHHDLKSLTEQTDAMIKELIREIHSANTKKANTNIRSNGIVQAMTDDQLAQLTMRMAQLEAEVRGLGALLEAKFSAQIGVSRRALPNS